MAAAAESFSQNDQRPLKVYFQDEARFGRMRNPVRCWAPRTVRPSVPLQRVREYVHVYSAVCPSDGDSFSLILPFTNTDMMALFMGKFSEYTKDYRVVMAMDGASWHKAMILGTFENLRIIYQPPYSPEVNPAEHLWDHLREKYFDNRSWDSLNELEITLTRALCDVSLDKKVIQSLVGFHWAIF